MRIHNVKINQLTITAVLSLLLLTDCSPNGNDQLSAGQNQAMPPAEVDVVTVAAGSATLTRDLPGRLQAYRTAQVRARVEGIVEKRLFVEGSDVKEGAPLFQIDARTYAAEVEAAQADMEAARLVVERYKPLLKKEVLSKQMYDEAEARFKQTEAALARARLDLENTRVPAPIRGRIGRALVTEGALVGRDEATPMAVIEQIDPIYANFTQPGGDVLRLQRAVREGRMRPSDSRRVELLLEDGSIYPLPGELFFADMAVDPETGSISLRAQFPNPGRELLPGMFVRIRFPEAIADNVIQVPQRAVRGDEEGQYVMLVSAEGTAVQQPVVTGRMVKGDFIITEGLKGGEKLVVNGFHKIRPGSPVNAVLLDDRSGNDTSRTTNSNAGEEYPATGNNGYSGDIGKEG